jgi:hypothetical protein
MALSSSLFGLLLAAASVSAIPYSEYILAPESRTLYPSSIYKVNGSVTAAESLVGTADGSAIFNGISSVTFDYSINIAGVVSITVGQSSSSDAVLGLTYTESSLWINGQGSDATANSGLDEVLWLPVGQGPGTYTVERFHERGGYRYLSVVNNSTATIEVTSVVTNYTAAPQQDLKAYKGYFHCNDELLNRIWYAGEYLIPFPYIHFVHHQLTASSERRVYESAVQYRSSIRQCPSPSWNPRFDTGDLSARDGYGPWRP